jgi:3-oxoacyl-[acyl-carrier-protein] synthase II
MKSFIEKRRVVITGMGVITPLGSTLTKFWSGLISGKSGIKLITQFDTSDFPVKIAGTVTDFEPAKYMPEKMADRTARFTQFAVAASKMAAESAGIDFSKEDRWRIGVSVGMSFAPAEIISENDALEKRGPKRVSPLYVSKVAPHMASVQPGMILGVSGPNVAVNAACASGAEGLATAYDYLKMGHADVMISGGTDSGICKVTLAALSVMGAVTRNEDPLTASRPFDLNRNGFVFGEGSGIMVLETLKHARERNATIIAELAGIGRSFDAFNDAAPDPEGEAVAMEKAIASAQLSIDDISYINAHGTSTKSNDISETKAIKSVFGKRAYDIPISSNKSMMGHIISAAGALEAIASVLTIKNGIIPPTVNYDTPDPECDLDYVPNKARQAKTDACLSNSFGMGGQNCCLVMKRFSE